jgi:valyl-tRNA synthetase
LSSVTIIGKDARMTNSAPEAYRGLDRYDARAKVVADLDAAGLLLKIEDHLHNVGHCQRSGVVVEPLISTQWFMEMKTLAEPALEAVRDGRTKFVPENMAKTYCNWLENIEDWCISRQLWWGHRIPAWYDEHGAVIVARSEAEAHSRYEKSGGTSAAPLQQDEDVLDTWFSSALWPFSTHGWPQETEDLKKLLSNYRLITGPDIIFFWVARMMMMGIKFMGDVPFRTCTSMASCWILKVRRCPRRRATSSIRWWFSRSTGLMQHALRWHRPPHRACRFPFRNQSSRRHATSPTKIWNATRFVLLNCGEELGGESLEWETELAPPELADRWILSRFNRIALDVSDALAEFRLHEAASLIYHFFWDDFCDWYIELSKPFVASREPGPEALAVRRRMIYVLERSLRLLHPMMPFISEELWQRMPRSGETICLSDFPVTNAAQLDGRAEKEMSFVIELVTRFRSIRSTFNLSPSTPLEARIAPADPEHRAIIESMSDHIRRLAKLGQLDLVDSISSGRGSARAIISGAEIEIPLAGTDRFR